VTSATRRRWRTLAVVLMLAIATPALTACVPPPVLDEFRRVAQHLLHPESSTATPAPTSTDRVYRGNTNFADLQVGDCVNDLAALDYTVILGLDVVSCDTPHDSEIYAIPMLSPASAYPGDDAVHRLADDACHAAFEPYVGITVERSDLDYDYYTPTKSGWNNDDDRTAMCVVFHDDDQTTGSVKGTAETSVTSS
jgi:hypothetical protein